MAKGSRRRNVDSGLHAQLQDDEGDSTRQSWVESSGLWLMLCWERQEGISHVSLVKVKAT